MLHSRLQLTKGCQPRGQGRWGRCVRCSQFHLSQEVEREEQQKCSTGFLLVSLFILLGTPAPNVVLSTQRMGLWA